MRYLVALLGVALMGCSDDPTSPQPSIAGRWTAPFAALELTQTGTTVTGIASIEGAPYDIAGTINRDGEVSLAFDGDDPFTFTGDLENPTRMEGLVEGRGTPFSVAFTKQPDP